MNCILPRADESGNVITEAISASQICFYKQKE